MSNRFRLVTTMAAAAMLALPVFATNAQSTPSSVVTI